VPAVARIFATRLKRDDENWSPPAEDELWLKKQLTARPTAQRAMYCPSTLLLQQLIWDASCLRTLISCWVCQYGHLMLYIGLT